MKREEATKRLTELAYATNWEEAHKEADQILCKLLNSLGCEDVVSAFNDVSKWYA